MGEPYVGGKSFRKKREAQSQSLPVYPAAWEMKIGVLKIIAVNEKLRQRANCPIWPAAIDSSSLLVCSLEETGTVSLGFDTREPLEHS